MPGFALLPVLLALSFSAESISPNGSLLWRAAARAAAIPKLNYEAGCRDVSKVDPHHTKYSACIAEERDARAQLQKDWASFSESSRSQCLQLATPPAVPSYLTLQQCLITSKDASRLSKGSPSPGLAGTPGLEGLSGK